MIRFKASLRALQPQSSAPTAFATFSTTAFMPVAVVIFSMVSPNPLLLSSLQI